VKREPIVGGGIRRLRASAGVEETGGDKDQEATFQHAGWITAREQSDPERGTRFL
jgi:hypothetical protein